LQRKLPALLARIWPARFVSISEAEGGAESEENDTQEYHGCYLIGLDWDEVDDQTRSKDKIQVTYSSLQAVLQRFEEQIRGDEKYYNPNTCWTSVSVVKRIELGALALDQREWGEYGTGDDEAASEDGEYEEGEDEEDTGEPEESLETAVARSRHAASNQAGASRGERPVGSSGKLRSATDVMNRLRWDANLDSSDYIVGYDDRFLGPKEKLLDLWKGEQTDEEFIPQHRILYFKRKSDGEIIWDRRTRKDSVFGSGGPPGSR
jgi:uncharacterized protein (UPF0248 family)